MSTATTHAPTEIANLPDDALIDVRAVSTLYGCSARHTWRMAELRRIPAPVRVGRLVRWRIGDVRSHIRAGCPSCRTTKGGA